MTTFRGLASGGRDIILRKWEELPKAVAHIRKSAGLNAANCAGKSLLFRGMSDADFALRSSLERSALAKDGKLLVRDYLRSIEDIRPTVESLRSNLSFPEVPLDEPNSFFSKGERWLPHYPYLIYLRHHGFPSPLLDWTASPYVAAFFAFRNERPRAYEGSANVAVFSFSERPTGLKHWSTNEPHVKGLGPRIRAHTRHIRQQSEYTICLQDVGSTWFVPYPDDLVSTDRETNQDVFWKISVPYTEREKALSELNLMNVNAYSLFDTDDSLMETLYTRCARQM